MHAAILKMRFLIFLSLCSLIACSSSNSNTNPSTGSSAFTLPAGVTWQWQLNGTLNLNYDVDVYDIDLFNTDQSEITALQARGITVICYFSAGTYEDFRSDSGDFDESDLGNPVEGFEDEKWLDIRSENVLAIMTARLDLAVSKNCDGVEPDNVDAYMNNSGFTLSASDQLSFNRNIANLAHERNLSAGLKNDLDQIEDLVDYFDFTVNEQCFEFDECEELSPFIEANKAVLNAEYDDNYVNNSSLICPSAQSLQLSTLIMPLDLDDSFRISCDD